MCRSEWQRPQRSMRTRTSLPFGFGVSTMVSHKGASNLTRDWRRISAMASSPRAVSSGRLRFYASYIGQFAGHGNKAGDWNGFGAPGRVDMRGLGQPGGIDRERFQALPQHFAALAEGGGCHLFEGA